MSGLKNLVRVHKWILDEKRQRLAGLRQLFDRMADDIEILEETLAAERKAAKRVAQIKFAQEQADNYEKKAAEQNRAALVADSKGQVSKSKRAYEAALTFDLRAKEFLGKTAGVQRVATDLAMLEKAQKQIEKINKHVVLVHLSLASLHMKERNFKRARIHVGTALQLDPMNKRAIELREEIAKHSIHRKASDLTNAKGRVTSGR